MLRNFTSLVILAHNLDVLEHVPRPMEVLEMLWDRLKPGGQALFWFDHSYPAAGHLKESIDCISEFDHWFYKATEIHERGMVDWVEKPRRWWQA